MRRSARKSIQSPGQIERLISQSRERYALPREVVEEEIASREKGESYEEPEKRWRQDTLATYFQR